MIALIDDDLLAFGLLRVRFLGKVLNDLRLYFLNLDGRRYL